MSKKKPYEPRTIVHCKSRDEIPESLSSGFEEFRNEVEGQYRFHVSPEFTTVVGTDRRYIEVSESFCQLVGYPRHDLIGKTFDEITAPRTNDIPTVFRLLIRNGYMHGLWMLVHRRGTAVLVRYEAWVRPDCQIQSNMELVRRFI